MGRPAAVVRSKTWTLPCADPPLDLYKLDREGKGWLVRKRWGRVPGTLQEPLRGVMRGRVEEPNATAAADCAPSPRVKTLRMTLV